MGASLKNQVPDQTDMARPPGPLFFRAGAHHSHAGMGGHLPDTAREHAGEGMSRSLFNDLVRVWNDDTMMSSSMREICTHWAYQRVIGLGFEAVPLIMERIKEGDRHWGWALTSITGENPAEECDSLQEASEAWLQWGAQKGLSSA